MPPNPPSYTHGFAMHSMSFRDMQIPKSEKKNFLAPPSQILGTPLMNNVLFSLTYIRCIQGLYPPPPPPRYAISNNSRSIAMAANSAKFKGGSI